MLKKYFSKISRLMIKPRQASALAFASILVSSTAVLGMEDINDNRPKGQKIPLPHLPLKQEAKKTVKRDYNYLTSCIFFEGWEKRNKLKDFHTFSCSFIDDCGNLGLSFETKYFKIDAQCSEDIDHLENLWCTDGKYEVGKTNKVSRIDAFAPIMYNKGKNQHELCLTDLIPTGGEEGDKEVHLFPVQEITKEEFNKK
jgi:hypothetical protein